MEVTISYRKLVAETRYGKFICEITERPVMKFGSYSDSEYGSTVKLAGSDRVHAVKINCINEPNIIHSWEAILVLHLELMKKNALLAESETTELRQAVQCYFHDMNMENFKPLNGHRIPLWNGEWEHKEDGWTYFMERYQSENASYPKDKVTRTRNVTQGDIEIEETQTKVMSRYARTFPLYPISPEGITAVFK